MRPEVPDETAGLLRRCLNREPNHRPAAADAARVLGDEPGAAAESVTPGRRGGLDAEAGDLRQLIRRRVPQIVAIAAGAGLGLMGLMAQFVEMSVVPPVAYRLTLPFVGCGIVAATTVAWFHGERGRQQASVLEWILLGIVAVVWLAISGWILFGG